MNVVEKLVAATTKELPVITTNDFETKSTVKGYHVYKYIWVPKMGENCSAEREPDNSEDKYTVCVKEERSYNRTFATLKIW